ncbi:MAG TPA: ParA family protein [Thermoanaerobaculia bacterium]|nr:ParA family protein [Thermoanaerobaculia bacterium]
MPRILAIANPRPGSGKTTTTARLGQALVELGHTVLLVDLVPSADLTRALGVDPASLDHSVHSLLRAGLADLPRMTRRLRERFFLLPASPLLRDAAPAGAGTTLPLDRLRLALRAYPIPFDFVLIDTPSSLGVLTLNALAASSGVLVPAPCLPPVLPGIGELVDQVLQVKQQLNAEVSILGFLATRLDAASPTSLDALTELREALPNRLLPWVLDEGMGPATAETFHQIAIGLDGLRF